VQIAIGGKLARDCLHTIAIGELQPVAVSVIWSSEDKAGLAFSQPLQPEAVEGVVMQSLYRRLNARTPRPGPQSDRLENLPRFRFDKPPHGTFR